VVDLEVAVVDAVMPVPEALLHLLIVQQTVRMDTLRAMGVIVAVVKTLKPFSMIGVPMMAVPNQLLKLLI